MKHWQNKWEKDIGDRLGGAEVTPDDQMWSSIEQELDRRAPRRLAWWRLSAILLLLSASGGLLISPYGTTGKLALNAPEMPAANSISVYKTNIDPVSDAEVLAQTDIDPEVRTEVSVNPGPDLTEEDFIASAIPFTAVEISSNIGQLVEVADQSFMAEHEESIEEISIFRPVFEPTAIMDRPYNLSNGIAVAARNELRSIHALVPTAIVESQQAARSIESRAIAPAELDARKQLEKLNPLASYIEREWTSVETASESVIGSADIIQGDLAFDPTLMPAERMAMGESELVHPGDIEIPGAEILVPENQNDLLALETLAQLSGRYSGKTKPSEIGTELSMLPDLPRDMKPFTDQLDELVEDEIAGLADELQAEAVSERAWIAEVMDEFGKWKDEVESLEEEEELEELIEEAMLGEEDPLTQRQKESQDLYRTYNINKGFHIGLMGGAQHTWVTRATRNEEIDRSVAEYRFTPGYVAGISMGYDFSNRLGIQAEIKYSDEGSNYYNTLKQREERMDLKYLEVPIYLKIKHGKMTEKLRPIVFNYLAGFYFSDLRKVTMTAGGVEDQRFGQDYNTSEWGLTAGMDFDLYINKNLFWSIGTRAGVGGLSKSFPKLRGDDKQGAVNVDVAFVTKLSYRIPGK